MKVLAEERYQVILSKLKQNGFVKIADICAETRCSKSSARRDLQVLEQEGLLERVHGGAQVKQPLQSEMAMADKSNKNHDYKVEIARKAAGLINDNDVIFLDAGSTTLELAKMLKRRENITVVTNSVLHAAILSDQGIRTIVLGGILKNNTRAITGANTVMELQHYNFNKVFLGINSIHPRYGLTTPDPDEAAVKREALHQGEKCYVLADSSKFDQLSFVKVADCQAATIITAGLPDEIAAKFKKQSFI